MKGDDIYNGADDDASGTTAVLELARVLGKRASSATHRNFRACSAARRPAARGRLIFASIRRCLLRTSRSTWNSKCWDAPTPPSDRTRCGSPDGSARISGPRWRLAEPSWSGDPHPEQNFFARSDNYVLAKKGVVAQTVSSYGLHSDYHQPSDDVAHIDFKHMDAAIGSLLAASQLAGELVIHAEVE